MGQHWVWLPLSERLSPVRFENHRAHCTVDACFGHCLLSATFRTFLAKLSFRPIPAFVKIAEGVPSTPPKPNVVDKEQ